MRIHKVQAFPIRIKRETGWLAGQESRDITDYGDYFIDNAFFTSIYPKHHETAVVRIETDSGIVGWGESFAPVGARATAQIVEDLVAPIVLRQDPFDAEFLWYRAYSAMRERGHATGFYVDALSGVDQALYDIIGKAIDKPAAKVLGGVCRSKVRVYAGFGGTDPDDMARRAKELIGFGYTALKLHLRVSNAEIEEIVKAVRGTIGPYVEIMVDVHTTRDVSEAISLGRRLEAWNVRWLESPTGPEDIDGQAEIARALDMQVASAEWVRTAYEWRWWLEKRGVDCAMPDIGRTGLTEGRRIAHLCDVYNVPVAPHVGAGGILAIAAGIQLSATIPKFQILEHGHHALAVKAAFASEYPQPVDGHFILDDKPGLGVTVDENKLAEMVIS